MCKTRICNNFLIQWDVVLSIQIKFVMYSFNIVCRILLIINEFWEFYQECNTLASWHLELLLWITWNYNFLLIFIFWKKFISLSYCTSLSIYNWQQMFGDLVITIGSVIRFIQCSQNKYDSDQIRVLNYTSIHIWKFHNLSSILSSTWWQQQDVSYNEVHVFLLYLI